MRRATVIAFAMLITAVAAPAAEAQRPAIEILSPQRGADHVSPNKPMRVRVRLAPGVRLVRAVATGRKQRVVTRRLHRRRGRIWTGTLRIGRELNRGPGALSVRGRLRGERVAAGTHFFVISRRAEMLRVRGLPRHTTARPLQVRLKTAQRVDDVRVRVNGHGARDAFTGTAGGTWRATLSTSHGLRFGRNRVVITAYDRGGAFERVKRIVDVRRGRPFAGASDDRLIWEHEQLRLDGRSTLPRKAERLRLTWRIVQRPRGSKARLRNRHAVRPLLQPDRPGTYRVRLIATPRRSSRTASAAAAPSADTVNVGVQPAAPPKGIPVQTIGANDGQASGPGIGIAGQWKPMGNGAVQMIELDGGTLEIRDNETYAGTDDGMASLLSKINGVSHSSVVILQNPSTRSLDLSKNGSNQLGQVLAKLGVTPDSTTGEWAGSVPAGGWSVVSATDGRTGAALIGIKESPNRPEGEMDGYLQAGAWTARYEPGSTYVFTWPSTFNTFDTQSAGDNGTYNEMTIAGQTYRSGTISSGSTAFHVVWFDAGTLELRGQATIPGDQGNQLAQTLDGIANQGPSLLFMTTIGHPNIPRPSDGAANGFAQAAQEIASFGGNASAFLSLNGSGNAGYSLVGLSGSGDQAPNAGDDVSRVLEPSVPAPRLMGVLDRRPAGAWSVASGGAPTNAASVDALIPDIKRVLAQPDQPFQDFTGPGQAEAEKYIADSLGMHNDPQYGIRVNYWDPAKDAFWESNALKLLTMLPCADSPCNQGFETVKNQLLPEFIAVGEVRLYFGNYDSGTLYGALHDAYQSNVWGFDAVSEDITSKYPPPEPESPSIGTSPADILEGMVDVAAELAPLAGPEAESASMALGVVGAAIEIGAGSADIFLEESGSAETYLGATVFEAQASQFASVLENNFDESLKGLNRIADLLVSDAGRLQAAGTKVQGDWAVGDLSTTLGRSIGAYLWQSLLPGTFKAYQCVVPPVYYPPEDFRPAPWYPWGINTPSELQYTPFTTVTHHPQKKNPWGYLGRDGSQINDGFVTIGRYFRGKHEYLDDAAAGNIFGPVDAGDVNPLGQLPAYFLAPQPNKNAPGFDVDQGTFDPGDADENGYVRYSCASNNWREDTNVQGQG